MAIRVLICEDAPGFALLARSWLDEDPQLTVVGLAQTAAEAVGDAQQLAPDIVLLDRTLPDAAGVDEVVARLRDASPASAIVLMSSLPADQLACDAARVGAQASVPKTALAQELRDVIHGVIRGSENLSRPD
jgi:DNA-binding NarL/FixJ family response regulator